MLLYQILAPFINYISESEINNTQVVDGHYIDVEMPMYNLIEHSDIYLKTLESFWQYYRFSCR